MMIKGSLVDVLNVETVRGSRDCVWRERDGVENSFGIKQVARL